MTDPGSVVGEPGFNLFSLSVEGVSFRLALTWP